MTEDEDEGSNARSNAYQNGNVNWRAKESDGKHKYVF